MKNVKTFLLSFIPRYISDRIVLNVWKLSNAPICAKKRQRHYSENKTQWKNNIAYAVKNGYIEAQPLLTDMKLGHCPASYNSCEVIAVYNVLYALHDKYTDNIEEAFPKLIEMFEKTGLSLGGRFGSTPNTIIKVIKKLGHDTDILTGRSITRSSVDLMSKRYHVYIATVYNDKNDISKMIHTVCITRSKDVYLIHNAGMAKEKHDLYDALFSLSSSQSRPLSLIGIR